MLVILSRQAEVEKLGNFFTKKNCHELVVYEVKTKKGIDKTATVIRDTSTKKIILLD